MANTVSPACTKSRAAPAGRANAHSPVAGNRLQDESTNASEARFGGKMTRARSAVRKAVGDSAREQPGGRSLYKGLLDCHSARVKGYLSKPEVSQAQQSCLSGQARRLLNASRNVVDAAEIGDSAANQFLDDLAAVDALCEALTLELENLALSGANTAWVDGIRERIHALRNEANGMCEPMAYVLRGKVAGSGTHDFLAAARNVVKGFLDVGAEMARLQGMQPGAEMATQYLVQRFTAYNTATFCAPWQEAGGAGIDLDSREGALHSMAGVLLGRDGGVVAMFSQQARADLAENEDGGPGLLMRVDAGDLQARAFFHDITVAKAAHFALTVECDALLGDHIASVEDAQAYFQELGILSGLMDKLPGAMARVLADRSDMVAQQGLHVIASAVEQRFRDLAPSMWAKRNSGLKTPAPAACLFDLMFERITVPHITGLEGGDARDPTERIDFRQWHACRLECVDQRGDSGAAPLRNLFRSAEKALMLHRKY